MKREKTVTAYTCDCGGAEIDDRATASITMSLCHAAYFCKGWEDARGCRIEHDAAVAYGLEVLYED